MGLIVWLTMIWVLQFLSKRGCDLCVTLRGALFLSLWLHPITSVPRWTSTMGSQRRCHVWPCCLCSVFRNYNPKLDTSSISLAFEGQMPNSFRGMFLLAFLVVVPFSPFSQRWAMAASIALNTPLSTILSFLSFIRFNPPFLHQANISSFLCRCDRTSRLTIRSGTLHEHLDSGAICTTKWLNFKSLFTHTSWLVHPSIHLRQLYMVLARLEALTSACVRRIIRNRHPPPPLALRARAAMISVCHSLQRRAGLYKHVVCRQFNSSTIKLVII
jgi:hypothetical protein